LVLISANFPIYDDLVYNWLTSTSANLCSRLAGTCRTDIPFPIDLSQGDVIPQRAEAVEDKI